MKANESERDGVCSAVQPRRLLNTAHKLIAVPSRTGEAKGVLDCLADLLTAEGFAVERPTGGYPQAPAVAVRLAGEKPGRALQVHRALHTVHFPFLPPSVEGDLPGRSGCPDSKAGPAA